MFELTPQERRLRRNDGFEFFRPFADFDNLFREFPSTDMFLTDIKDNGDSLILEADLPGFKKEDIKIDLKDNYLTITAERKTKNDQKDDKGNYIRRERSYGSFSRSFNVQAINTENITASYNDGVLSLNLPKKEKTLPSSRSIEIG